MSGLIGIPYTVRCVNDVFGTDPEDDNIDVTVAFETGEHFTATFFTIRNLESLMEKYHETGECAGGLYVWSKHMIVVARLTIQNIEHTVADLLESGEFASAFDGPFRSS
jgi:hypothetical protein